MNNIRQIEKLNEREIKEGVPPSASWHRDYNSAYIYIGGLPYELSEGDVLTIFSQYGEPVWVKLARDRETGKSRGFAFLKYEDQRSTDLAVDNLSGAEVLGRKLNVDHKVFPEGEVPEDDDEEGMNLMAELEIEEAKEVDRSKPQEEDDDARPILKEEQELREMIVKLDDDDPMKESLIERKREEVQKAIRRWEKENRKRTHRASRRHKHRRQHLRPERLENGQSRYDGARRTSPGPDNVRSYRGYHSRENIRLQREHAGSISPPRRSRDKRSSSRDSITASRDRRYRRRES